MLSYASNASVQQSRELAPCLRGDGGHAYHLRSQGGLQRFPHTLSLNLLRRAPVPAPTADVGPNNINNNRRKQPGSSTSGVAGVPEPARGAEAPSIGALHLLTLGALGLAGVLLSLGLVDVNLNVRALERRVNVLTDLTARRMESFRKENQEVAEQVRQRLSTAEGRLRRDLGNLLRKEIWLLNNDKTGLVDFALYSAGGRVVSINNTKPYEAADSTLSFLGMRIYSLRSSDPSALIRPDMSPGACWAFRGSQGEVVLSLLGHVRLSAVSLEHISSSVAATGATTSAPRDFSILGLDSLNADPVLLGRFTFIQPGPSLQFFRISNSVKPERSYRLIAMRIHSNHGHPQFTCVYRLRVHGSLDPQTQQWQVQGRTSINREIGQGTSRFARREL